MFCSKKTNTMINKIYERALRIVLNDHISDFETMLRNINDITIHHRNVQSLMIELFKIKNNLAPPVMDSMLSKRTICYNFRNLQEFYSKRKRTVFYGFETKSYRAPQLRTILPDEFKQRKTITLFKCDVREWICNECPCRLCKVFVLNLGFLWNRAPNLVFFIYHVLFYAYMSHLAGRCMSNWEYNSVCLLFDMHLLASTHFMNFNFFILLCFFVVDVN